jgi:hypothetical protein
LQITDLAVVDGNAVVMPVESVYESLNAGLHQVAQHTGRLPRLLQYTNKPCTVLYGSDVDPDPHQIKIRIHIKVISWIPNRIRVRINLRMTSQNVWNMSLFYHFFQKNLNSDPHPDPHQDDKSNPDPHQRDADPHHCCMVYSASGLAHIQDQTPGSGLRSNSGADPETSRPNNKSK